MQLRQIREHRGLSIPEAARLLNRDPSAVSKAETGNRGIRRPALENMLDRYGISDEALREHLFALARDSYKKGWWQQHGGMLSPETMDLISLEADALSMEFFELTLIPGLLQTEAYARAVISVGFAGQAPERLDRLVAIRLKRQEVLTKSDPPRLLAIIDEAALRRQVGSPEVMRGQLRKLITLSGLAHVTLQVLPFSTGEHGGMTGGFKILRVGEIGDLSVVVVDSLTQISYREQDHEIHAYSAAFSHLSTTALPESDSRELIQRLLSEI